MPERIPTSVAKLVVFRAYLASDHVSPATSQTIAITVSKNGGAFGNPNAGATNATEISAGFYKFTLDTTDTNTAGPLAWRGAVGTIDDAADIYTVTASTGGLLDVNVGSHTAGSIAAASFAASAITSTVLAADCITAAKIADGAIDAATFAASAITSTVLADNAITAAKIASDAITDAKVASDVTIASVTGAVGSVTGAVGSVTGNVGGNVTGSVGSVTTVSDKTGYRLSAAGVDDFHDEVIDDTMTLRQAARLWNAVLTGKATGLGTTTAIYRDIADSKDRITATVDADGNRTVVTRDAT